MKAPQFVFASVLLCAVADSHALAAARHPPRAGHTASWMAPDAKRNDLLYISDLDANAVDVFSYPAGKREGTLTGLRSPKGECVDGKGNIFVVNSGESNIVEFAHGGTSPIATLNDTGWYPFDCSFDRTTGNLAVTNNSVGSAPGSVSLYKRARGNPALYTASNMFFYYSCAYDDSGNLYLDGSVLHTDAFAFAEMLAGTQTFTPVTLNQTIRTPGGVKWDGRYIAVGDQGVASEGSEVYEFSIRGNAGTEVGSTPLGGSTDVNRFWLQGSKLIGPDASGKVYVWTYPAGGNPVKTLTGFEAPDGVAISKADST